MYHIVMALSRKYQLCHRFAAVIAILYLSLSMLPLKSGGIKTRISEEELRKTVLGSKPPACVNKCMRCRPCEATLVIPPHINRANFVNSAHGEDGTYYLLAWKCRCGKKLYQP
ncbi:hypothetical protein ACS0TY_020726 [Phlomoides rotata]